MKPEVMIDIETLGLPENLPGNAVIAVVEIAAIKFDGNGILDQLHMFPSEGNGSIDENTVAWWIKQCRIPAWVDARDRGLDKPIVDCLSSLSEFCQGAESIWTRKPFDLDVLKNQYLIRQMYQPWSHKTRRDLYTLAEEVGAPKLHNENPHDAMPDCAVQVNQLIECRKILRGAA